MNSHPKKKLYSRCIGSYTSTANESLYFTGRKGRKWELVQINNSLFYIIDWNFMLDFSSDNDSTNKLLFQFIDKSPVEFEKVKN